MRFIGLFVVFFALLSYCYCKPTSEVAVCDACREFVKFSKKVVDHFDDETVKYSLVQWCQNSGYGPGEKLCPILIQDVYKQFELVDPDTFCSRVEACQFAYLPPFSTGDAIFPGNNATCDFCVDTVISVKALASAPETKDELKNLLMRSCQFFGSLKDECTKVLGANLDQLINYVAYQLNPKKFCEVVSLCAKSEQLQIEEVVNIFPVGLVKPAPLATSKDSKKCVICREIVKYVYDFVRDQRTEQNIEAALGEVCSIFFLEDAQLRCRSIIKDKAERLIQLLVEGTEPELVCVILGYCIAVEDSLAAVPSAPAIKATNENCGLCKLVVEYVLKELKDNKTEQGIIQALDRVCTELLPAKDVPMCKSFVEQYATELINIILQEADPETACIMIGLCPSKSNKVEIPFLTIQNTATRVVKVKGPNCVLCKTVLKWLYKELEDNRTEEAIISALDAVCDALLPQADRVKCEAWVKQYTVQIINIITTEADPELACALLGQCAMVRNQVLPFVRIQPALRIKSKPTTKICGQNSTVCDLCKDVFTYLHAQVTDTGTRAQIENALNQVCATLFPGKCPEKPKCEAFVKDNVDYIINALAKDTDPNYACDVIGFCAAGRPVETKNNGLEHDEASEVTNAFLDHEDRSDKCIGDNVNSKGALCDVCRQIFDWLHSKISDPSMKSEILQALDQVCKVIFPGNCPEKPKCINFVTENTEAIIDALSNYTDPDTVCRKFRVCVYNKDENRVRVIEKEGKPLKTKNDEVCYGCQLMAHYIQVKLYDYKTEQAINNFIENELCHRMASTYLKSVCDELINEYGVLIEQLIAQRVFDPETLCDKELKVCPHNSNIAEVEHKPETNPQLEFELVKPEKEEECRLCTMAVNELDKLLETGSMEKDLSKVSAKICNSVPESKRVKCSDFMTTFGPHFFHMIGELSDAKEVCKSIDLCYIPGQVHLLGGRKCTFGPTYWCHTNAHAQACKATNYCKMKVWKPIQN